MHAMSIKQLNNNFQDNMLTSLACSKHGEGKKSKKDKKKDKKKKNRKAAKSKAKSKPKKEKKAMHV